MKIIFDSILLRIDIRIVSCLFILLVSVNFVFGQNGGIARLAKIPCSQNLLNAKIRNYSLGVSKDIVNKDFVDIKWQTEDENLQIAKIREFNDKIRFEGVSKIQFKAYENILYQIDITYSDSENINIRDFANSITQSWKTKIKWIGSGLILLSACKQRFITVSALLNEKTLSLKDSVTSEKIRKKKESKKKIFTP